MAEGGGELLQAFYLALNDGSTERAIECLGKLENITNTECGPGGDEQVLVEITKDCRKKMGHLLRSGYVGSVQQLLTLSRKRLHMKATLGSGPSTQHAQRHLNTLIELLGEWSNVVNDLSDLDISSETLTVAIDPLHARVVEMSIDCFKQFIDDKGLADWQTRIRRCVAEDQILNISALDQIIGQLAGMRSVVAQYQRFLSNYCVFTNLTNHDMTEWREADGVYIALEYGYMLGAMREATTVTSLLELQDGSVYALQAVEDCFFVVQRSLERAISTSQKGNIYAISARLVELIDPHQLEGGERNVYQILTARESFKRKRLTAAMNDLASPPILDAAQHKTVPSQVNSSTLQNQKQSIPPPIVEGMTDAVEAVLEGNISSGVTTLSATIAGMAGGFLEVVAPTNALIDEEAIDTQIAQAASNTIETFIDALTEDIDTASDEQDSSSLRTMLDLAAGIPPTKSSLPSATKYPRSILCIEDASLQLNSLAIPVNALNIVASLIGEENLGKVSTLDVAREEIARVQEEYGQLLIRETQAIAAAEFYGGLYAQYDSLGAVPGTGVYIRAVIENLSDYEVTGNEMDRRSSHSELVSAVSLCINDTTSIGETNSIKGWISAGFGPRLSTRAFAELLKQIAVLISEAIVERMLVVRFNEWGSMLIHQEIHQCLSILETVAATVDVSIHDSMKEAVWAATVITLDQPADIRRYHIPQGVLTEDTIRSLMRQRVEFSSDAIKGVKIV